MILESIIYLKNLHLPINRENGEKNIVAIDERFNALLERKTLWRES